MQYSEYDDGNFKMVLLENEKKIKELEIKNQEYLNEIDAFKKLNEKKLNDHEKLLRESILNSTLHNLLQLKDNEILENKKENELLMKRYLDDNYRLKEEVDLLTEKNVEFEEMKVEHEKLKKKAKELEILKDKMVLHEKSVLELQTKNNQIDFLTKEKQNYILSVDKLQKDIIIEKDKARVVENEKRKLENEIIDLKRENTKLSKKLDDFKSDSIHNESDIIISDFKSNYKDFLKRKSLGNGNKEDKISFDKETIFELNRALEKIKILEKEVKINFNLGNKFKK